MSQRGLVYIKGRVFSGPDEVVIDDIFAKDKNLDVGDDLELKIIILKYPGLSRMAKASGFSWNLPRHRN
jgi:hypothetical protein